jgi:hypothetical protein
VVAQIGGWTAMSEESPGTRIVPGAEPSPGHKNSHSDKHWSWGLWAVLFGIVALLVAYMAALIVNGGFDSEDIAALGLIASPIVALVSAYFGIDATQKASKETARAAEATGEAVKQASDAEMRAREAESAANMGAIQGRDQLRGEALKKLEELALSDPTVDRESAEHAAAFAWDEIQRGSGLFPETAEPKDPEGSASVN